MIYMRTRTQNLDSSCMWFLPSLPVRPANPCASRADEADDATPVVEMLLSDGHCEAQCAAWASELHCTVGPLRRWVPDHHERIETCLEGGMYSQSCVKECILPGVCYTISPSSPAAPGGGGGATWAALSSVWRRRASMVPDHNSFCTASVVLASDALESATGAASTSPAAPRAPPRAHPRDCFR